MLPVARPTPGAGMLRLEFGVTRTDPGRADGSGEGLLGMTSRPRP